MAHYPLADVLWGTDHSYVVDNRETKMPTTLTRRGAPQYSPK